MVADHLTGVVLVLERGELVGVDGIKLFLHRQRWGGTSQCQSQAAFRLINHFVTKDRGLYNNTFKSRNYCRIVLS